jgi:hypothetical protein
VLNISYITGLNHGLPRKVSLDHVTRAGNISRYTSGTGVLLSLGIYLLSHNGDLLFYAVLASLIVGQLLEYILQILFYRTAL